MGPVNSVEPPAPIRYWDENKDGTASTRLVGLMSEDWQGCVTCRLEERQRREEEERVGLSDDGCRLGLAPVGTSSTCRRSDLSADIRRVWRPTMKEAVERSGRNHHVWANSPPLRRLPKLWNGRGLLGGWICAMNVTACNAVDVSPPVLA